MNKDPYQEKIKILIFFYSLELEFLYEKIEIRINPTEDSGTIEINPPQI